MALSRYKDLDIIKVDGKRTIESFPEVTEEDIQDNQNDLFIRIEAGQRLDTLAHQYLGDGRYWWVICLANNISFGLGNEVVPGTILRVPTNIDKVFNVILKKVKSL